MRIFNPWRALVAAAAAAPSAVFAHTGLAEMQDAFHGFMHPIAGLDHVFAMVAVGVIAAQWGGRALWALPACFVAAMAIAGACAMAGLALPGAEVG
ncbi:MAG TPA: HupE/UreJ family protein, partial [Pseudoxanthomonas sp.]